jgi:hypothetical protein
MRGGKREGSGRKSKAEEMGLPALIEEVIGDEGKKLLVKGIFSKAQQGSFLHQQLLMHYIYGKPTDKLDLTSGGNALETIKHVIEFRDYSDGDSAGVQS